MKQDRYNDEIRKSQGFSPELPQNEIDDRLRRLREGLKADGIDAAFIFGSPLDPTWVRYYANYIPAVQVSEAMLFVSAKEKEPILLIDRDWYLAAAKEITGMKDIRVYPFVKYLHAREGMAEVFGKIISDHGLQNARIGLSLVTMPTLYYQAFTDAFTKVDFVDVTHTLNRMGEYKSPYDIKMVRESAAIADKGMAAAIEGCRAGATEYEAGVAAELAMCAAGCDFGVGATVRTHITIGSASTIPSNVRGYSYTGRILEKGDFFYIDLSTCYKGYYTDFCRTVSIGKPSKEQQRMYDCTMATHKKLLEMVKPGTKGEDLFKAGLQVALDWGYEPDQINNIWLGHGTGLMVSDSPFFQMGEDRSVQANMFVNIEPGLFIPKYGSTSVEDQLFVTESGNEIVTQTPREIHVR